MRQSRSEGQRVSEREQVTEGKGKCENVTVRVRVRVRERASEIECVCVCEFVRFESMSVWRAQMTE